MLRVLCSKDKPPPAAAFVVDAVTFAESTNVVPVLTALTENVYAVFFSKPVVRFIGDVGEEALDFRVADIFAFAVYDTPVIGTPFESNAGIKGTVAVKPVVVTVPITGPGFVSVLNDGLAEGIKVLPVLAAVTVKVYVVFAVNPFTMIGDTPVAVLIVAPILAVRVYVIPVKAVPALSVTPVYVTDAVTLETVTVPIIGPHPDIDLGKDVEVPHTVVAVAVIV